MNFELMPELQVALRLHVGHLGLMVSVPTALVLWFQKKGWL